MGARRLIILGVAAALVLGCSASSLKQQKDDAWGHMPQTLADGEYIYNPALPKLSTLPDPTWSGYSPVPNAYGHPFRPLGFFLHPIGVAFDWVVVRPLYM